MLNFGNLGGTLYCTTIPLCEFKFVEGFVDTNRVIVYETNPHPAAITDYYKQHQWQLFFEEQIVPRTRQNLLDTLRKSTPIRAYVPEQLLRLCKCRNSANPFWVECDNDLSCWEPWQIVWLREHNYLK